MRAASDMACDHDGCGHVLDVKEIPKKAEAGVGTSRRPRSHITAQETRQTEKSHD